MSTRQWVLDSVWSVSLILSRGVTKHRGRSASDTVTSSVQPGVVDRSKTNQNDRESIGCSAVFRGACTKCCHVWSGRLLRTILSSAREPAEVHTQVRSAFPPTADVHDVPEQNHRSENPLVPYSSLILPFKSNHSYLALGLSTKTRKNLPAMLVKSRTLFRTKCLKHHGLLHNVYSMQSKL